MADSYDVIVLGGGTGGYSAAIRAASLGMTVALVERDLVGGTCLHRGCIPTKALLHSAEVLDTIRDASKFGITAPEPSFDWAGVQKNKSSVVDRMFKGLEGLLRKRKIEIVRGTGSLTGPRAVAVDGKTITAAKGIVVATGSKPKTLPGLDLGPTVLTSDQALGLDRVPASAVILGGGAIGAEFASLWASFGCAVTIVEMLPSLVPLEDAALGKELQRAFSKRGITSLVGATLEEAKATDASVTCQVKAGEETRTLEAEVLLVAVGRAPVTEGAGLDAAGIATDRGFVTVGPFGETSASGVYAVGDVIPTPQLAHVSFAEGIVAAERLAGLDPRPINYDAIPRCTYCEPEVAAVGLTESQAKERGADVVTQTTNFAHIGKAQILGSGTGFCKIVADKGGAILGVHLIGSRVTELLAEAMLAVGWEAVPDEVAQLIHPHPTLSEVFGEGALALAGKPLHT